MSCPYNGLAEYFAHLLAEKYRHPADDLLSRLTTGWEEDPLDDAEIIATAVQLFPAGYETTARLLGNGLHALLDAPDQLELLRHRPELTAPAVEEMLRHSGPSHLAARQVRRPTTFAGADLEPGQLAMAVIGAADRDPARFPDPDRFDVTRDDGTHLAFAGGTHYCLGAHLARLETAIVLRRLLDTFPRIEGAVPRCPPRA